MRKRSGKAISNRDLWGKVLDTLEGFEKNPKTSGNATKVYKEECVTRSKSKSSLEIEREKEMIKRTDRKFLRIYVVHLKGCI